MKAEKSQRCQGSNTSGEDVVLLVEVELVRREAGLISHGLNVEGHGVNYREQETEISTPSMQYIQSLVVNAGQEGDEIGLHTEANDPWHHCDRNHASSDRQRW